MQTTCLRGGLFKSCNASHFRVAVCTAVVTLDESSRGGGDVVLLFGRRRSRHKARVYILTYSTWVYGVSATKRKKRNKKNRSSSNPLASGCWLTTLWHLFVKITRLVPAPAAAAAVWMDVATISSDCLSNAKGDLYFLFFSFKFKIKSKRSRR